MIVLDTNVLSEAMRRRPAPQVLAWLDRQAVESLFLTAVTEAEILYGIARLPDRRRRRDMAARADATFAKDFQGRSLPFDRAAAREYAAIAVARAAAGRPISQFDCQIAAVARSRGAAVATRNTADFEGCGLTLVNPWEER